jgi:hypothetical protein
VLRRNEATYLNRPVSNLVGICQVHLCAAVANLACATQHNPLPAQEHLEDTQLSKCSLKVPFAASWQTHDTWSENPAAAGAFS